MQKKWVALFFLVLPLLLWCDEDPMWSHAAVSAYAMNLKTGEVIVDFQGERSMMPASCMKVVTTGAALHVLGPESVFQTNLEIEGEIKEGILQGNLWIHGGGDPCLGSDRMSSSLPWDKQVERWADAVEQHGIQEICGDVIGDASQWEKNQAVPSWSWEDVGNYYGAGASALSFHENTYSVYFSPGSKEGDATLLKRVVPAISYLALQNEVKTGPEGSGDRACIYGSELSAVHYARGTIPAGVSEFSIKGSIPNPAQLCADLLSKTLQRRGIRIRHKAGISHLKKSVIHTTQSPKVQEIVYWTNQQSINLYAEHLLKSMGEKIYRDGSTLQGTQAVLEFWKGQGIDTSGMYIADGSGLSRKNFVTAKQLVLILQKMQQSPYFSRFYQSLPEVREGIRAKSGSMSFIRGCVGYKGNIAFAMLINHGPDAQKMQRKLDQWMAELPSDQIYLQPQGLCVEK